MPNDYPNRGAEITGDADYSLFNDVSVDVLGSVENGTITMITKRLLFDQATHEYNFVNAEFKQLTNGIINQNIINTTDMKKIVLSSVSIVDYKLDTDYSAIIAEDNNVDLFMHNITIKNKILFINDF